MASNAPKKKPTVAKRKQFNMFPLLHRTVGISSKKPMQLMFLPPSTKSPLFVYNNGYDQRSFLSLAESNNSQNSTSTFRSLPSTIEATDDELQSINAWLEEERERRSLTGDIEVNYGSVNPESEYNHEYSEDIGSTSNYNSISAAGRPSSRKSIVSIEAIIDDEIEEDFANEVVTSEKEMKKLVRYSIPLMLTFFLEQIFSLICVIFVGHLGKEQLAAVSMASMTSTIVFAIFEGIATALDTLCPQAYGSGQIEHVGIHTQRCSLFSLAVFLPAALFWWFSGFFLSFILEDEKVIELTQTFLRILILGGPPYILFENGKRFLQAQGIFDACTYILLFTAPFNVFLNWLFVYHLNWGYVGAPIASVISFWTLFILLVLYVIFIEGDECWEGFTFKALTQWWDLIKLAVPGVIMMLAESLAYEILTLLASYFGTSALAAQSALSSLVSLLYMIPFALSVASSTRIANFVGGNNIKGGETGIKVGLLTALLIGSINGGLIWIFGDHIGKLFTKDEEVLKMISHLSWLIAVFVTFDSLVCMENGILRALGLQSIGGIFSLVGYYLISVPLAFFLSFHLDWNLEGLWIGNFVGLASIGIMEIFYIKEVDWETVIQIARDRIENN